MYLTVGALANDFFGVLFIIISHVGGGGGGVAARNMHRFVNDFADPRRVRQLSIVVLDGGVVL